MAEKKKPSVHFEIDPNELKDGTCKVIPSGTQRFAVCKEGNKIKVFEVVPEET